MESKWMEGQRERQTDGEKEGRKEKKERWMTVNRLGRTD